MAINANAGLITELRGDPGSGKSSLVKQFASQFKLKLIDQRVTQADPTDLNGYPFLDANKERSFMYPPGWLPMEGDPVPEGYTGWLLFWDERPDGDEAVQKALYKIFLDRKVGDRNLHPAVVQIAAGNLEDSNCYAQPDSDAIKLRLNKIYLMTEKDNWLRWAFLNGIDQRIIGYIGWKSSDLNTYSEMQPDHDSCGNPRGWFNVHKQLTQGELDLSKRIALPMLSSSVGLACASNFLTFTKCYKDLPTHESIVNTPSTAIMPAESGTLHAVAGNISIKATPETMEPIMEYVRRMPKEFQTCCVVSITRLNADLIDTNPVNDWMKDNVQLVAV
jgi:hypothetical protein